MAQTQEIGNLPPDEPVEAQPSSPRRALAQLRQWLNETLRHPFILLIAASILTSFIIPRIGVTTRLQEARLKKALEIVDQSTQVDRHLNNLQTTLEIFHKDNSGVAARLVNYKEEQKELRRVMMARYLEFDKIAWWWYSNLHIEARLLDLTSPAELEYISSFIHSYEANLVESTNNLNDLWNAFLRKEYEPTDLQNSRTMQETREKLKQLEQSRRKLIGDLTQLLVAR